MVFHVILMFDFEAIGLKTIPVQEIRNDMKLLNIELEFKNLIYFRHLET